MKLGLCALVASGYKPRWIPERSLVSWRSLYQFGVLVGGRVNPKAKDPKTFFFFDYQGQYIRQGQTYISTLPVAAFRNGDFSASTLKIYYPLTQTQNAQRQYVRSQFPGNVIPQSRLNSVGQNLINLFPQPNLPGLANHYLYNPIRATNERDFDSRVDHRFSDSDSAWVRFSWSNSDLTEPSSGRR